MPLRKLQPAKIGGQAQFHPQGHDAVSSSAREIERAALLGAGWISAMVGKDVRRTAECPENFVCCLYADGPDRRIHSEIQASAPWFGTEGWVVQIVSPDSLKRRQVGPLDASMRQSLQAGECD